MTHVARTSLWGRWVAANALAEGMGLGATLALDYLVITLAAGLGPVLAPLASILLIAGTGAVEGTFVGLLQWSVLQRAFPSITKRAWTLSTIAGAVVAWFLGSLPSTLMDMSAQAGEAPVQEPPQWIVLLLAAGMGLVLGVILGYPQWRVLRTTTEGASIWIVANALAWGVGMPIIFAAMDLAFRGTSLAQTILVILAGLLIAGAAVGAVHGAFLVRLARQVEGDKATR